MMKAIFYVFLWKKVVLIIGINLVFVVNWLNDGSFSGGYTQLAFRISQY